jgi:hypothetical protein
VGGYGPRPALTRLGLFLGASVVGAAAAGVQLLPAVDYVTEHSRRTATTTEADEAENVAYSSSYSLNPEDVVSYVVPEFTGNQAGGAAWAEATYWGRNFAKDNTQYAGVVVLLLAGLSFFGGRRGGLRWFFVGLGTVALFYALGRHTPVWRVFYEVLPGISLFRAPDVASFLVGFSTVTLAAFGVDRALDFARGGGRGDEAAQSAERYLWIAAGVLALLMLLAASGALLSLWTALVYRDIGPFQLQALERARPFILRGSMVAAVLAAVAAATVWAGRKALLRPLGVTAVLALLIAVDALRIDSAFVQTLEDYLGVDFHAWTTPDPNLAYLLERQGEEPPFRVASLKQGGQDVGPAMFGLELATGHHPNDLARYRELIGMRGSGFPENLFHPNVLRLLNIRYLIVPAELGELEGVEPVSQTQVGGRPYEAVFPVDGLPRARLVAAAEVVPEADVLARVLDPAFDPARTVLLSEPPPVPLSGAEAAGEVVWLERGVNRMRLSVTSGGPALLVIADNWFPSWRARVDGVEVPVMRAYHTLRAVPVGEGEQMVELYYESTLLRGSLAVSLVTLALLLGVATFSSIRSRGRGAAPAGP